jgi:hypothetical protein
VDLFWETEGLHNGRMTAVCDKDNRVRFLLRRSLSETLNYKLLNADAKIIGSISCNQSNPGHLDVTLGNQNYGTLIKLAGSNHPLYVLRGANWLISGTVATNRYSAYHGISAVFSTEPLADGASIQLWCMNSDNAAASLLIVSALDQVRMNTIHKQEPLSYSF